MPRNVNTEPEDITEARKKVRFYDSELRKAEEDHRKAEDDKRNQAWVAANVEKWFSVKEEFWGGYERDERHTIQFQAKLISADKQEGRMEWSNGVITEGIYAHYHLKPEEIPE